VGLLVLLKTEACDVPETQRRIMQFHTEGLILSKVAASRPISQPVTPRPAGCACCSPGTTNDMSVNAALSNCTQTNLFGLQSLMTAKRWELFLEDFSEPRYLASNDHVVAMATYSTPAVMTDEKRHCADENIGTRVTHLSLAQVRK